MMILNILILCSVVVIAAGGRSPHADYVEELARTNAFGSRISDNIMEDATLDLPGLVNKYNYPFQEHSVITQDGYILRMHRIPHGRDAHNAPGDRPVVFLMHGLCSSSADHVVMGPGSAMAYILAEEGYDVWMGNARGNYFSRRHILLNPDALFNSDFWEFSWDEIGFYDLPAMIDYILRITRRSGLHYIGHSQGTTAFFVMASRRPEYNEKIISMQALAPVAYMAYNRNRIFLRLAPHARELAELATRIGFGEIFPRNDIFSWAGQSLCRDGSISQPLCSAIIFLVVGWNEEEHNATMLPVNLGHAPSGAAFRQIAHYGQSITEKEFRRYDFGILRNLVEYGSAFPPRYDLSRITAPVFLHYSENDPFAHVNDVDRLHRELGNSVGMFVVPQPTFSHLDFIWGNNAKTLVFDRVISFMRLMGNL